MSDVFVFEPFASVGEVVGILTTEGSWIYRVISYAEPLPPSEEGMIKDFGAISNNQTKEDQAVSLIKMRSNELGQFRFEVLDNIKVKLAQPKGLARFQSKETIAWVTPLTKQKDPTMKMTEFFVYKTDTVYFTVKNESGEDLTKSRIQFYGWRFVLEDWEAWLRRKQKKLEDALTAVEDEIEKLKRERKESEVRRKRVLLRNLRDRLAEVEYELALGEPSRVKRVVATGKGGS